MASNVRGGGNIEKHEYAVIKQYVNATASQSTINIWKPVVERNNEFSLSQIWLSRGSRKENQLQTIEAGWQVSQQRHGDRLPHFFIDYTADNYKTKGCYDLECPAFIQTDPSVVIGMPLPGSVRDGTQQEGTVAFWRDPGTGHWWLTVGEGVNRILVGYYPTSLFDSTGLKNFADEIAYGGEIVNREIGGRHTATDMGSGEFPESGYRRAAYQRSLRYMDINQNILDVILGVIIINNPLCYGLKHDYNETWGRYFYYGGRGYSPDCS